MVIKIHEIRLRSVDGIYLRYVVSSGNRVNCWAVFAYSVHVCLQIGVKNVVSSLG